MSITLTNQEQFIVGGNAIETSTIAGLTSLNIDYISGTMYFLLSTGAMINSNIQQSQRGAKVQVSVNFITGVVQVNGAIVGTIGSPALSTLNNILKNIRNQLETAVVNQNIIVGTQVSW